ncbi:MAG: SDR family NAD(P)-dependent oxidoreductase [Sporocytophaga sp.]|uniref:SDR family NAD(P)-dependent oxidoreductase n=1 Tax=Sporocytophaga sp. TaxID=2231183 RepID=UPI001B0DC28B|nr:SDR family NAD(P)-dependent oxidoreductase [Sporocytophaga sp.]MBO9701849.1 SDR family NAD(P)-dependent oxidoreductase [Sporocytophaga sp.]
MEQNRKTAMITGANSGVGLELTKKLLLENWDIIALIRSDFPENERTIHEAITSKKLRVYKADISDFKSLKSALIEIKKSEYSIDVLFNNAGVGIGELKYSPQGRELHYEVNTVAPYIIAMEMKALLNKGIDKTIVNTSSNILLTVKKFDPKILEKPANFKKLFGSYAFSKLALTLWTKEVSKAMKTEGIEIRSVCPGGNKTQMTGSDGMPFLLKWVAKFAFPHPRNGAKKVYDAFANFKGVIGDFIEKGKITPTKFSEMSSTILNKVDYIYKQEYQCA